MRAVRQFLPPVPELGHRFTELETLRGVAAINVFVGHFFLAFTPHAHGLLYPDEPDSLVRSPLFALMNGSSAVMFFFMLSGFVLTVKAFALRDPWPLASSAVKRWPRLAFPVCVVSLIVAAIAILGLYANRDAAAVTGSVWLDQWRYTFPGRSPNLSDALATVRRAIWREQHFQMSPQRTDHRKIPFRLPPAWAYAFCNAA